MTRYIRPGAIGKALEERSLSYTQAHRKTGVSRDSLLRWNKGGQAPRAERLHKFTNALGIEAETLLVQEEAEAMGLDRVISPDAPTWKDDRFEPLRITHTDPFEIANAAYSLQRLTDSTDRLTVRTLTQKLMTIDQIDAADALRKLILETLEGEWRNYEDGMYLQDPLRDDPFWIHRQAAHIQQRLNDLEALELKGYIKPYKIWRHVKETG